MSVKLEAILFGMAPPMELFFSFGIGWAFMRVRWGLAVLFATLRSCTAAAPKEKERAD